MNPREQECFGRYLYGAGYFARDENTLGMVTGHGAAQPHFCLGCPKRAACENEHEKLVREQAPAQCEAFDRRMAEARRRDIPPTLAAMYLGQRGLDPFASFAIANFGKGHADRGRESGALVQG